MINKSDGHCRNFGVSWHVTTVQCDLTNYIILLCLLDRASL